MWAGEHETDLGVAAADALIAADRHSGMRTLPAFFTIHSTGPAAPGVRDELRTAGVPLLHGLRPALMAIWGAWSWQRWRQRTPLPAAGPPPPIDLPDRPVVLSERQSRDVLAGYGIPLVPCVPAQTEGDAADAAERLGYPVVVKADIEGVAHKAAAGLVVLGVVGEDAVRAAFRHVTARASDLAGAPVGALVQSTAAGVELICGMRRDPVFGPVIVLGVGGTLTEVVRAVATRPCPPSVEDLEEMFDECAVGRLIDAAGAGRAPVADVLAALARIALDQPRVLEIDVNPLFAAREGVAAADALVVVGDGELPRGKDGG
jgi:acyl-CoA synthetase (NDP forming)